MLSTTPHRAGPNLTSCFAVLLAAANVHVVDLQSVHCRDTGLACLVHAGRESQQYNLLRGPSGFGIRLVVSLP